MISAWWVLAAFVGGWIIGLLTRERILKDDEEDVE